MIHEFLICENDDGSYSLRIEGQWEPRTCTSRDSVLGVINEEMESWERRAYRAQ